LAGKTRVTSAETKATVSEDGNIVFGDYNEDSSALNTAIEDLNLSARTTNALVNNDIHSIKELFSLSDAELRDLKGFGSKALEEVKEKLAELEL
jgi:DNA-directed RNA polymerase subunit alpha